MATTCRDPKVASAREILDVFLGLLFLLAILVTFLGLLALPAYLAGLLVSEWSGSACLGFSTGAALGVAETYVLALIAGRDRSGD